MGEAKRRKALNANYGKEDKDRYYKQMTQTLPSHFKPDLGHLIFKEAEKEEVIISLDPSLSDAFASALAIYTKAHGQITDAKKIALTTNSGVIFNNGGGIFDIVCSNGREIGTFVFTEEYFNLFVFSQHPVLVGRVMIKERFFRNHQWVIPIEVIGCYPEIKNALETFPEGKEVFSFSDSSFQYSIEESRFKTVSKKISLQPQPA